MKEEKPKNLIKIEKGFYQTHSWHEVYENAKLHFKEKKQIYMIFFYT